MFLSYDIYEGVIYTMKNLDSYFINRATCAILPVDKGISKVYEIDNVYTVDKSVMDIVEESCKYYGCSYKGRLEGTRNMLNMNYKLPIVVEEFHNLIFFPTSSPRFGQCIWLSLNNISSYEKCDVGIKIIFKSDLELPFELSYYSVENQIFRATMLESLLRKRRNS